MLLPPLYILNEFMFDQLHSKTNPLRKLKIQNKKFKSAIKKCSYHVIIKVFS